MDIKFIESSNLPPGEHIAEVAEIKQEQGNFGAQFRWTFHVLSPDGSVRKRILGWTSISPSLKSKFARWTQACLGRPPKADETVKTSDLVGSKVMLVVVVEETEDGAEFNKVDNIKPLKRDRFTGEILSYE